MRLPPKWLRRQMALMLPEFKLGDKMLLKRIGRKWYPVYSNEEALYVPSFTIWEEVEPVVVALCRMHDMKATIFPADGKDLCWVKISETPACTSFVPATYDGAGKTLVAATIRVLRKFFETDETAKGRRH